ncbi:uncharacterized protein LOC131231748 [Magnolia sinica]|uniref:uncharacterized protein LOC131231748 n=1 Tax=Magnolia sinica TaxID=86752 RepID=UPI002659A1B7|nr:uncharacterized protein LOC131231748 [Magnolia sinica]
MNRYGVGEYKRKGEVGGRDGRAYGERKWDGQAGQDRRGSRLTAGAYVRGSVTFLLGREQLLSEAPNPGSPTSSAPISPVLPLPLPPPLHKQGQAQLSLLLLSALSLSLSIIYLQEVYVYNKVGNSPLSLSEVQVYNKATMHSFIATLSISTIPRIGIFGRDRIFVDGIIITMDLNIALENNSKTTAAAIAVFSP